MLIHSADGSSREAAILSLAGETMRVAIAGCEDVCEFTLCRGQWVSERLDVIRFSFPPGPGKHEQFARAMRESVRVPSMLPKTCRAIQ